MLGLGHAIYLSNEYIKDDDEILIILGDTLFNTNNNLKYISYE